MIRKILSFGIVMIIFLSFSGCKDEIHQKLVADAIILENNKLNLLKDSNENESKIYSVNYTTFNNSCEEIELKYNYKPFLSHTNEVYISTEVSVEQLKEFIKELKANYQISPNVRLYLAEENVISLFKESKITTDEVKRSIQNQHYCDERICNYDNLRINNEFAVLQEYDGNISVRREII
jgi:hypothetical protein